MASTAYQFIRSQRAGSARMIRALFWNHENGS